MGVGRDDHGPGREGAMLGLRSELPLLVSILIRHAAGVHGPGRAKAMRGLMSDQPLLVSMLIRHAASFHGDVEIVSRTVEGGIHRYTYAEAERRARQLAKALRRLGIEPGDRVGTLAWNTHRHFELYYAISGIGAVCHTINPRLFDEQIVYIVNHARDRLLFVDAHFIPLHSCAA